ncbi:uncharacterized protein LOC144904619 isoform X3 [Branchiostoma floridae x Branchiostoma belcheri]
MDSPRTNIPKRKSLKKGSVHHKDVNDEEGGWTESYLRSQMKGSKELDLSNKTLEEIPPSVFNITEVEILDVSDNQLGSIPVSIANLSNLTEMRATGCDLREISGNVSKCKFLTKIDFSRNPHITTFPATMKQLVHLKYLTLSDCKLKSFPNNLTLLATIETLDVSKNVLTTLPSEVSGLKRLKVLILNDNVFESIPETVKSLARLDRLEMKRNKLNNRQGDLRLNAPSKLKILDLTDNCSLHLLPDGVENLEVIECLNFSFCGIETVPDSIGQLSTLKEIHLAGNKLRTLPDSFGRLLNLETLDLEGNCRLSSLPLTLHHLRKLKDKETGTNTGLVLNNIPVLDIPEPKIVQEGVVSVLSELLTEDSLNGVTANIAAEVVDDTIVDNLSDDIVTIVEGGLSDGLMMDMTDVALVEEHCVDDIFAIIFEDVIQALMMEVMEEAADEDMAIYAVCLDSVAWEVMEELHQEITDATAKSIALEQEEEWRLGQTVPDEYDKEFSCEISATSTTVQCVDLPAGCNLSIPPGATDEDTSVISAVLNPHGYEGTLQLRDNDLLVSDIIEMRPSGMTFSKPVQLKIPHSLPRYDSEREYIVMTSEDDGRTWVALETQCEYQQGQKFVTVEVTHFSSFAVVARPLKHYHKGRKGESSTLTSSDQTGIKMILPEDSIPEEQEISFTVTPVDRDVLACAGMEDSIDNMSHIINFFKGSNLLLDRPATIVLPLSPGEQDSRVRVLSCNEDGDWEDVTSKVEDVVLQGSKVAFKTDRLSSGNVPSVAVDSGFPIIDFEQLEFQERSLLGQGAFASVKKAFHRNWRQHVALKSLTFEIYGTSEQDLLYSEARKLDLGSRSDYVIRLLGICLEPNFAIVMPFMENGCLSELLQDVDVPWALRWRMARQIAQGMTFLHCQNPQIIHCDLKAENVLLDGDFHVKISDFGLSKWKMQSRIVTETSPMGGTPTHVPPEFFDTDDGPTDKTDVYSFSVLLWEIATRRRPYRDDQGRLNLNTPLSCYVIGGGRPDMSLIPRGVPGVDTVSQLMQACWSQCPDDRPSFQECVDQLRDVTDMFSDEDVSEAIINVRRKKKTVVK